MSSYKPGQIYKYDNVTLYNLIEGQIEYLRKLEERVKDLEAHAGPTLVKSKQKKDMDLLDFILTNDLEGLRGHK